MARPAFTLAALVTAALPGTEIANARARTTGQSGDFDAAEVMTVDGRHLIVRVPRTQSAERDQSADVQALRALSEGVRQRLPFRVPSYLGQAPIGPTRGIVYDFIPGTQLTADALTSDAQLAASVGRTIASIHSLPTSVAIEAGLPNVTAAQARIETDELIKKASATGLVPAALVRRWSEATDDDALWQFVPTVINGEIAPDSFLVVGDEVRGVMGWAELSVGDPARDVHWLLAARGPYAELALSSYVAARGGVSETVLPRRALLYGELELARWLLHGHAHHDTAIVDDAVALLDALVANVHADAAPTITNETGPILTMAQVESMLDSTPSVATAGPAVSLMTDSYDRSEFERAAAEESTAAAPKWMTPPIASVGTEGASADSPEPVALDRSVFEGVREYEPADTDHISTEPLNIPKLEDDPLADTER